MKILAQNKRALFDYNILEKVEAGLVLTGIETKAIKNGKMSLKGSYVTLKTAPRDQTQEAYLINAHISPYQPLNTSPEYDPARSRKLLLHRKELKSLLGKTKPKGLTLVPLKVYTKKGRIKIEIALGQGKRQADKRETIKKREIERQIAHMMKRKSRG